jgi:hypothetical protein
MEQNDHSQQLPAGVLEKDATRVRDSGSRMSPAADKKYIWIFIAILIAAIAFRGYYFYLTLNQPLWFDEANYMSAAKGYAGIMPYSLESTRLPGFPAVMSLFFITGLSNETFMRFMALFLPSIFIIILVYLVLKEMYPDRRIALIGMALMAVLWENVFYSNRFMTENWSLMFQLAAFYIFFKFVHSRTIKIRFFHTIFDI